MPQFSSGYKIAHRRLTRLAAEEYLRVSKTDSGENVYYTKKKLSYHDILINSFFAALVGYGAVNIYYERPKEWLGGKIRSDAFFKYDYGDYTFFNILEVCLTHKKIPIERYEELFNFNEAHQICRGTFPRLIIMDETEHYRLNHYKSSLFPIIQVDFSLKNMPLIFMD
jgi:hypothetical protein